MGTNKEKQRKSMIKACLAVALIHSLSPMISVRAYAQEGIDYDQLVSREACQILLKGEGQLKETDPSANQAQNQYDKNQVRMTAINERYQVINQEIAQLESGSVNSLAEAKAAISEIVDTLYEEYSLVDKQFDQLDSDQQWAILSQDERLSEWLTYQSKIEGLIQDYVLERNELEGEYRTLSYDNETLAASLDQDQSAQAQLNQCQLYPYSVKRMAPEHLMLNPSSASLSDYLLDVDQYLGQLVPKAYSKLSYQAIFDIYNKKTSLEEIKQFLADKSLKKLDEDAFAAYQYARELSLFDIQVIAALALQDYYQTNNKQVYHASYSNLLNLKERQLAYFYSLNEEVFEKLKQGLANYLNQKGFTNEQTIQQIRNLHQRYQIKLVLFDPNQGQWKANPAKESGYFTEFANQTLWQTPQVDSKGNPIQTSTNPSADLPLLTSDKSLEPSTPSVNKDKLAHLKDKLDRASEGSSQAKSQSLAKPPSLNLKKKEADATTQEAKKPKSLEDSLPSTGEQRFYFYLSLIVLLLGIAVLIYNRYLKRKNKPPLDEEDWD